MTAITKFAQGKECTARIPGVCNRDPATSVWSHLNSVRWGAGRSQKAPDVCGLIACYNCHMVIDRQHKTDHDREFVMQCAYEGHMESLAMLVKEGVIK